MEIDFKSILKGIGILAGLYFFVVILISLVAFSLALAILPFAVLYVIIEKIVETTKENQKKQNSNLG